MSKRTQKSYEMVLNKNPEDINTVHDIADLKISLADQKSSKNLWIRDNVDMFTPR